MPLKGTVRGLFRRLKGAVTDALARVEVTARFSILSCITTKFRNFILLRICLILEQRGTDFFRRFM